MRKFLILCSLLLMIIMPVSGQDDLPETTDVIGDLTLESVIDLRAAYEEFSEINDTFFSALSPDGQMIGLLLQRDYRLCLYTIAIGEFVCSPPAETRLWSAPYWSADGRYIAVHANVHIFGDESDIHLLDTSTMEWTVLFDDGEDSIIRNESEAMLIDQLPTWHPETNDLYFFRSHIVNEEWVEEIMVVRAEDGIIPANPQAEQIADISNIVDTPVSMYESLITSLNGVTSISPDGRMMAFVQRREGYADDTGQVLLLDLETNTFRVLVEGDEIRNAGMPDWYRRDLRGGIRWDTLDGLAWRSDSAGIYVTISAGIREYESLSPLVTFVDIESGEVTPLLDYSDVPSLRAFTGSSDEESPYTLLDRQNYAAYIPSVDTFIYSLLYVRYVFEASGFGALVADEPDPTIIYVSERRVLGNAIAPSVGESGTTVRVLLFDLLMTFRREE